MPPTLHTDGDRCTKDHGNGREQCVWQDGKWHRGDGLDPCPFDSSN